MSDFLPVDAFLDEFVPAVIDGDAAIFAGAGLSRSCGFVDWKGLLKDFAKELGLDLDIETDLVAVAQYHLNSQGRVRDRLNQKIATELSRAATPGEAHISLALIPIHTYWTSNYDCLIEQALTDAHRPPAVRRARKSLTTTPRGKVCEVLKLHGDVSEPDGVVITKEDYEKYAHENEQLLTRLKNDLLSKSFLFIGFSFTDPNLELVLSQVRQMAGDNPRSHYAVFREPKKDEFSTPARYRYELNRWKLRLRDLGRYGVHPVIVNDYEELPELLRQIRVRAERRRILVSGSFSQEGPWARKRLEEFCQLLGQRIVAEGYDLANGFGLGVGSPLIAGALEELYRGTPQLLERRLLLRPFPQIASGRLSREALWRSYRRDLVSPVGFAVFIAGNKVDETGTVVSANGVRAEYEIARELGKYPLPIGATGWVADELWQEVLEDFDAIFPSGTSRRAFRALGSKKASDASILDALFSLINQLTPRGHS